MIHLLAPEGELPLAFQQYEHLATGTATPFLDAGTGRPLRMARLDDALGAEGIGTKHIAITLAYSDTGGGALQETTVATDVIGTLDAQGLARVIHAQARQFAGKKRPGESPPEMFVTAIAITTRKPKAPPKARRARGVKGRPVRQYVKVRNPRTGKLASRPIYRDKTTGRFAKRAEWEALKGNATR